jgi:1-acyl-sn-glycerol-3-phosphate acyltransferase
MAYTYPRRVALRSVLRALLRGALHSAARLRITGRQNLPAGGPLLVVANHFHFIDGPLLAAVVPYPIEYLGGFQFPNAPFWVSGLPALWGYYPVYRGSVSKRALQAAESILRQGGVLGLFPEGWAGAPVLRPARPGTAFLAARTGARILPVGFTGVPDIFPALKRGQRAEVTVRIGQPFGPLRVTGRGRARRAQIDAYGHTIMQHIAALLPDENRGFYADDPQTRARAEALETIYPFDDQPETITGPKGAPLRNLGHKHIES